MKLINAFKNHINKNGGPVAVRGAEQARAEGAGFAASYSRAPEVQSVHMSPTFRCLRIWTFDFPPGFLLTESSMVFSDFLNR